MRRRIGLMLTTAAALVLGLTLGLRWGVMPLGVPGEWEWPRLPATITAADPSLALLGLTLYLAFATLVAWRLARRSGPLVEAAAVAGLVVSAVVAQLALHAGAPEGYGLTKWVTLNQPGASGYFRVAQTQMPDVPRFLAAYPEWIATQDALHIGTHPPGLFLTSRAALGAMDAHPETARAIADHLPATVNQGMRAAFGSRPAPERAALALIGALTLLACSATVAPLYLLARATLDAPAAWATAALWPLVPAAILFQPTADTAFPLLSTTALACAVWSGPSRRGLTAAVASGIALAVGMQFSLVFLAVGLIVALVLGSRPGTAWRWRLSPIVATGLGFLAATLAWWAFTRANPFVIWWWNQRHHARFYVEYPRSYRAWVLANPIELAVALGLPVVVWGLLGLSSPRRARVAWATLAVLAALTLSGRNLSEVGRLWLPFQPALVTAAGAGLARLNTGPWGVLATLGLLAAETLVLEAAIQVVYPF